MGDRCLAIKHHLRVEPADEETVFLLGERERFMLRGRIYRLLGPLLDGRRTEAELVTALSDEASAAEVLHALGRLEERGYLAEPAPAPQSAGFWQAIGESAGRAAERLAATPVAVIAVGEDDPRALAALSDAALGALSDAGVAAAEGEPALVVVVTRDYLAGELEAWNRRALREGVRWVPIKPGGVEPWIGPVFRPGAGPCWACLAHRLRHNRPVEAYLQRRRGLAGPLLPPPVGLPAGRAAALDLAAVLVAGWIAAGGAGPLDDRLISLDLARARTAEHVVAQRPQCPACGDPEGARARAGAPVRLEPRPKRFTDDGGHRIASPEETLARTLHLVSPISGIVASLGPLEGRDHPLRPVYGATYRVCPAAGAPSFDDFHSASGGKGKTPAQARAGALSEAVERYSAVFQGDEPLIRARRAELGAAAIHPHDLQNFSDAQYSGRRAAGAAAEHPRHAAPLPFREDTAIDWAPAWSLTRDARRFLPAAYCYLHLPVPPEERFAAPSPSGHAAGNCLEEAILQGFLELVERDAVALWWYNRAARPAVDLRSFEEPYFEALSAHYRALGRRLWVLDVTTDLGIPAFVAAARAADTGRLTLGFGCHLEARLGVQRALTELNQLFDPRDRARAAWQDVVSGGANHVRPAEGAPPRRCGDHEGAPSDDLRDDVRACVARAARAGLETVVLDQTRPDTGLSAVKVVVPGLRHIWPRFGPGRLYDVPVRLGWLPRPTREEDLNPVPLVM
ncbi:TOMM precursor leader peptide-binding protein [Sorangium sp. So ce854]|uniref:TOMM precursor leader peptide-binding protein n=1 Tax=Sorangium sp. So ce854 TaxID=3133322 RepID=UPI003F62BF02